MFIEPNNPYPGYVYAFRVASNGPHLGPIPTKIGFCHYKSGDNRHAVTDRRLADIKRHHWENIYKVFCSDEIYDANVVEHIIHCKYKKYRIKGEWFNLTYRQVKNIRKYLKKHEECNYD